MTRISLTVNGRPVEADIAPRTHLADFLRERLNLTGTHLGCEHGVCGACTVEMNGAIVRSCITYAAACDGAEIRTIESFDDDAVMARLRTAFSREHALQCGYCTPGMLITARDLVLRKRGLDERDIRTEMSGNLCRCTGYVGIVRAIGSVMAEGVAAEANANGWLGPAPGPTSKVEPAAMPDAVAETGQITPQRAAASRKAQPQAIREIEITLGQTAERNGFTEIPQHFILPHAPDRVWALMSDLQAAADAMPGAELETVTAGNQVSGRMSVRLGPMRPSFAGQGTFEKDDAARTMTIDGSGHDKSSASTARGRIAYRLSPADGGAATRVDVTISYRLSGMLAQFGRGEIVRDVIRRLAALFARNIDARLSGGKPSSGEAADSGINALALLWAVLKTRMAAFFRRLAGRA